MHNPLKHMQRIRAHVLITEMRLINFEFSQYYMRNPLTAVCAVCVRTNSFMQFKLTECVRD